MLLKYDRGRKNVEFHGGLFAKKESYCVGKIIIALYLNSKRYSSSIPKGCLIAEKCQISDYLLLRESSMLIGFEIHSSDMPFL